MNSHLILAVVVTLTLLKYSESQSALRWCILKSEAQACNNLKTKAANEGLEFTCVQAPTKHACFRKIAAGEADFTSSDETQLFPAGKLYELVPVIASKIESGQNSSQDFKYKGVAVVKKDSTISSLTDLKGKKSCHTGVGKTTGWVIPLAVLQEKGGMSVVDCDNNVKTMAGYFKESCAPGAKSSIYDPEGDNPDTICSLCEDNKCPTDDEYSGYSGALKCLKNGRGEVAFVKHTTYLDVIPAGERDDYRLLCLDGSKKPLTDWSSCSWGTRPAPVVVSPEGKSAEVIKLMKDLDSKFGKSGTSDTSMFDGSGLLFEKSVMGFKDISQADMTYEKYLGDFLKTMTKVNECKNPITWCTVSDNENNKCMDMQSAAAAKRVSPEFMCYQGKSHADCMAQIQQKKADLVNLDGGDAYKAGKISPPLDAIVAETYPGIGVQRTSYWAVAVVKKSNKDVNINNLKGKTSCHTGIGKTSGWNVPIGLLVEKEMIKVDNCHVGKAVGEFFRQSCVPGALQKEYNPGGTNPNNLCDLCGGASQCSRSNANKYYGYTGALRCLVERNADVAFVKHTTVASNTDGNNQDDWAKNLKSEDFELLCKDGTRKPVNKWTECSLAKVPSHAVMTSSSKSEKDRLHYWRFLDHAQGRFTSDTNADFKMFDSADQSGSDLMFKDSTVSLSRIPKDQQKVKDWLGQDYYAIVKALDVTCVSGAAKISPSLIPILLVVCALFKWFL